MVLAVQFATGTSGSSGVIWAEAGVAVAQIPARANIAFGTNFILPPVGALFWALELAALWAHSTTEEARRRGGLGGCVEFVKAAAGLPYSMGRLGALGAKLGLIRVGAGRYRFSVGLGTTGAGTWCISLRGGASFGVCFLGFFASRLLRSLFPMWTDWHNFAFIATPSIAGLKRSAKECAQDCSVLGLGIRLKVLRLFELPLDATWNAGSLLVDLLGGRAGRI
jgi:hypothetical protein